MHDLWPEVVEETKTQNPLWASLVAVLIDLLLHMTQATIQAIKSGDSMLKASLRTQLFDKERNFNGNLKPITTQMKNVSLAFSILNPFLSR